MLLLPLVDAEAYGGIMTHSKDSRDKISELRQHAESAFAQRAGDAVDISTLSHEEVQKLVYDLQVHQIELEMQNEELRGTLEELEASWNKYIDLYGFDPLGYLRLDQGGVILEAHLPGLRLLGIERDSLIGKPLASFVNKEDANVLYLHFRQVLEAQSTQTCDVQIIRKDGNEFRVSLESQVIGNHDESPSLRTAVIGVTKRKKPGETISASELRYRRLFESAEEGILILDFDTGQILDVNSYLINLLGYSHEEYLEKNLWEIGLLNNVAASKTLFAELQEKGYVRYEVLPLQSSDGWSIEVEFVSNSYSVNGKTFIQCNIRDITERKQAEAEITALNKTLEIRVAQRTAELEKVSERLKEEVEERKQAEVGLLREKSFSDAIIDVLPGTFYLFDEQGKMLRWNKNLEQMAEDLDREISKMRPRDFFGGDARSRVEEATHRGFAEGESSVEAEVTASDGNETPYLFTAKRVSLYDKQCLMGIGIDISDRVRAEGLKRKSEERLDLALKGADLGLWDLDVPTGRSVVNQRAANMAGYSLDEIDLTFDFFLNLIHPDDRPRVLDQLGSSFRGQTELYEVEYRVLVKSGEWRWILSRGKVVERDDTGGPLRMTGTFMDITDRKNIETELEESRERYRAVFENAAVGIDLVDEQGRFTHANAAFLNILGYAEEELRELTSLDITHPDDKEISKQQMEALVHGEIDSYRLEKRYIKKDGSIAWGDFSTSAIHDADGRYRMTVAVIAEITERKRAEEALRESEQRFRQVAENAGEWIWEVDANGIYRYCSSAVETILGYSPEELVGQKHFCDLFAPEVREELKQAALAAFERREPIRGLVNPNVHTDGRIIILETSGTPVQDEKGILLGYRGTHTDITERKEGQERQDHLRAQLFQAQKMEAVGTLAGGVAHDFNNLLQVALGFSELILEDEGLPQLHRADLQKINQAAKRGADLVQRLLTFSRKTEIKPQPLQLNRRITELQKMLERTIPKMIDIKLLLAGDLVTINADPTQIDQVLMNLAVNSRDAMPEGGKLVFETANVTLGEEYARTNLDANSGPHVLLTVTDTGTGMDKATVEHIFEPFYTTKGVGEGTGLGLAMVHGIVSQHGGHVRCHSELAQGTTFKVYFPALASEEEQDETIARKMPRGGSETILLVDDEEMIRDLGSRILSRSGYKVITASNGKEALDVYERRGGEIALVVLDLIMPEMGGKQCLEGLLRLDPAVRVVIASGYSAGGPTKDALSAGAKGSIAKPFNMRQVLDMVRETIDEGR